MEALLVGREGAVGGIVSQAIFRIRQDHNTDGRRPAVASRKRARRVQGPLAHGGAALRALCRLSGGADVPDRRLQRRHSIEQRTAKWIGAAIERSGSREVPLTQERLAPPCSRGPQLHQPRHRHLQRDGTLAVRRGHLVVRDEARLRSRSCNCHEAVKHHFNTVLKGVYPEG